MGTTNRREVLKRVSFILGGVIAAPIMAGAMGKVLNTQPEITADESQIQLITEIADVIIPDTTTPGAKKANVQDFIIRVVRDCYTTEEQKKFYNGLAKINDDSKTKFGKTFIDLTVDQKIEMLDDASVYSKDFFKMIKELTVTGYFTSEIGATLALAYDPIPGKFIGCVPLQVGQKTWAL